MPVYTTDDEEYPVPYGIPSTATCYINGTEYFFQSFKVINKLNQPSSFEVSLMDVTSSDTNVAYGMPIMFFIGNKLFLKGRMDRPKFMTDGYANVKGLGMEAALKDKIVTALTSPATAYGTNRFQYTNVNSNTIVNQICSLNGDGVAPWVVQPLVNTNFGLLSMRFENVDKMTAAATVSDSCTNDVGSSYDWWISQDINEAPNAFATDYFNISTRRGISSPTYTFYVSGDNLQNAVSTDREQDYESTATYVNINGYGDGINQIRTSCFNNTGDGVSSPRYTLTTQAVTATYKGNMTVAASSKLTAGIAIMGEERVTFTVVNGTTINLTARGTGSTTATTHPHGIYIANWIDPAESNIANWETGSAMKTQDRKEVSLDATNIIDIDTLQLIATRTLLDRMNVPERITLNPEDPFDATTNVNLGDAVTIVDADVGLNGTYRIVSEELDYGDSGVTITYEVSNRHLYLLESMNQIKTTGQNEAVASQGATNIYMTGETDNCDATHGLRIDFYIPDEAVALNKLKLTYKLEKYRIWASTAGHTHTLDIAAGGAHTHDVTVAAHTHTFATPTHYHSVLDNSDETGDPEYINYGNQPLHSDSHIAIYWRHALYLPWYTNGGYNDQGGTSNSGGGTTPTSTSTTHTHAGNTTSNSGALTYGISADPNAWGVSSLVINVDNATDRAPALATAKGSALVVAQDGTEAGSYMELSTYLAAPLAGGWHYILITPDANCRIQADIYLQMFIRSR